MNGKIKSIIIEDNENAMESLVKLIATHFSEIDIIGKHSTIKDSIKAIKNQNPELILMDIVLKDGNAFEILDHFPNNTFEVIFITAHSEFMKRAFEHFAFTFISKPFEDIELIRAIQGYSTKRKRIFDHQRLQILKDFIKEDGSKFLVHVGNEYLAVDISDVVNCKSDGNYTQLHLKSGKKLLASNPLKYYENLLAYKGFYRMNRFDLINMNHVKSIYKKETVILSNGTKISITSRNKIRLAELMESFKY
ncbi:response regulator transcription factor [Maribacter algarum]|uniref:Response regulator transcription factor n=1 Tax=Maribacter algarum (ex Zhang et al. 2020) TaxID=2578118 RepID=A0A5S3PVY7_9FLAO|nr:LytTR family DNA-binding domain-containing protein [Maribacter algarum]TMM59135.1 response regulator transcription factor [Maribacter algarum]